MSPPPPAHDPAPPARWRVPELAAAAALVGLAVLVLLRSQVFDGVTFGGDEYAYLATALFPEARLRATDPFLQGVSNHGYLSLVRLAAAGRAPLPLLHLMAATFYAAGGVLTILLARRFLDRLQALLVGVLWFLMPGTAFVSTAMPEPVYAAVFALAAWVLVPRDGRPGGLRAYGGGLVVGLLTSVKPHAVAVLLAACAYVAVLALIPSRSPAEPARRRAGLAAGRVGLVLAGFWAAATLAAGVLGGRWSLSPTTLVGGLYGGLARTAVTGSFWTGTFATVARYAGAHLSLLLMLFGVPGAAIAGAAYAVFRRSGGREETAAALAPGLLALLALAAAVAMTSVFSAMAIDAAEADRLHVRYYAFTLPLVMLGGLAAMRRPPPPAVVRLGGALALAGAACFPLLVSARLRLFPWDAADVFALFDRENAYWAWAGALACAFGAGAVCLLRSRTAVPAVLALWIVVFGLGDLSMFRWQGRLAKETGPLYRDARAFSELLQARGEGRGAVVGHDRYGSMSYVLAGLANAPYVRVVDGATLPATDVPADARWVVAVGPYAPGFAYATAIGSGSLTLYLLERGGRPTVWEARAVAVDDRVELSLADGQRGADLVGFNPAEPWGSWTATPVATVILRQALSGPYRMSLSAWTTAEGAGTPLRIRFGDREYAVALGTAPQEHRLAIDVAGPVDRFDLLMPIPRHQPWERPLGAAIEKVSFERAR